MAKQMQNHAYDHQSIEKKWQDAWSKEFQKSKITSSKSQSAQNARTDAKKYYVLEMFPYPSGRIHMGHVRNYVIGDALARHKRKQGYEVLHPMGWDSFGLPAENAARINSMHPQKWTENNISHMRQELKTLGLSIDWQREIATHSPEYYIQQQKLFILLWKNGLVIRKNSWVNWDPVDQTVLANEQVIDGRGWRSGALIERLMLPQWFFKITDFAEDLLTDMKTLKHWPELVINMQRNWIGKSTGAIINFVSVHDPSTVISVYSTRPETLFGGTYVSIAMEHPLVSDLQKQNTKIQKYIQSQIVNRSSQQSAKITGIFTGIHVIHPITREHLPVYINSGITSDYATGATFGCPAHDQLDLDFAKLFDLPRKIVVQSSQKPTDEDTAYTDTAGHMINSSFLNGLSVLQARKKMIYYLQDRNLGQSGVNYRLRDWGISRQRSWGCPIPMIHCENCQYLPDSNPVLMPQITKWQDEEIKKIKEQWRQVQCPHCGKPAQRETDTMDTFVDSAWYFLRFCSPHDSQPINLQQAQKYMPVDYYIGGIEHAILHLLYARFLCKALRKCGLDVPSEPFFRLFTQGMICHPTYKNQDDKWVYPEDIDWSDSKNPKEKVSGQPIIIGKSEAMSKSKCNTIAPEQIIQKYGSDALRWFILSDTPPERNMEWSDAKMQSTAKNLTKIWNISTNIIENIKDKKLFTDTLSSSAPSLTVKKRHDLVVQAQQILSQALDHLENLRLNSYIAQIYILTNCMQKFDVQDATNHSPLVIALQILCHLLSPITPHLAAEIWHRANFSEADINTISWPKIDTSMKENKQCNLAVQVNGKVKLIITLPADQDEESVVQLAKKALSDKPINIDLNKTQQIIYVPNRIINFVI